MPLPAFVLDQLGFPHGRLASLTGWFLNRVNRAAIHDAVALLELQPGQRVLEVGFGGGASLRLLLDAVGPTGEVFGTELSPELLTEARRRLIIPRLRGHLRLERAIVEKLPLPNASFDAVLSLHTIFFWLDVDRGFRELARVLVPGGRLVLGIGRPQELIELGFAQHGHRVVIPERLAAKLPEYGFDRVEIRESAGKQGSVLVLARKK